MSGGGLCIMSRYGRWLCFVILTFLSAFLAAEVTSAVTYELSGGRFGDCLISYLHAKWFAYKNDIPLVYKPFVFSTNLLLDEMELRNHPCKSGYSRNYLGVGLFPSVRGDMPPSVLHICPYFPEDPWELKNTLNLKGEPYYSFDVDWKDPEFRKIALAMIAPKRPYQLCEMKNEVIHVALHIREGGGYDFEDFRIRFPLKLPPMHFYIDGVRAVLDLFPGKKIEFHLFTDALMPEALVRQIQANIPRSTLIQFSCRNGSNHFNINTLADFYSLFLFDVMIRPQSNFSMIPTLLKDFAVVYAPKECSIEDGVVRIDEVSLEINHSLYEGLLQ